MLQDPILEQEVCGEPTRMCFFYARVTNTHSLSQIHLTTENILIKHEEEKQRNYNRCIMSTEHGTFTPLDFFCF